jgi:drug/metabolite transporter superfamily protein YnfA
MSKQTLGARLGSMIGFTLSGCFAAWAIVDEDRRTLMLALTVVTFILGLWLARRASKALYGKR